MKKFLKFSFFLSFGFALFLMNCGESEVIDETFCSEEVYITKFDDGYSISFYFNYSDDLPGDMLITATLTKQANPPEDVSDQVLTFNISEEEMADDIDRKIFLLSHDEFFCDSKQIIEYYSGYYSCNSFYNAPTFTIEFLGECEGEAVDISEDDIEEGEGTDEYAPSLVVLSGVTDQSDLSIVLFSNNPSGSNSITVTSSLGESEVVQLTEATEREGTFTGSLPTTLDYEAGTNNNGTIHAEDGTVLTVTFTDALDEDGNTTSVSATITVEGDLAPTCSDGIQNGDETGIDCGGSNCDACVSCSDGIQNGDEEGIDCGGSNCDACIVGGLTFEGVTYEITDASYLDYTANDKSYILFSLSKFQEDPIFQVFNVDIEIVSSTEITDQTYTFGNTDFGVTGSVGLNATPDYATITGGFVVLVITPTGDYALDLDLMTDKGALTGSHTVPSGL